MSNPVIYAKRCGDNSPQRYELVPAQTDSVYGSGRPGWGIRFKSDPSRRLVSDEWMWFESSAADRDAFVAKLVAEHGPK